LSTSLPHERSFVLTTRTRDTARPMQARDYIIVGAGSAGGVDLPFGGSRRSGFGRERGVKGVDACLRTRTIAARL
jgi:acyl-CoA reductase-like NAD-dependent aldehyde dehydrogenase